MMVFPQQGIGRRLETTCHTTRTNELKGDMHIHVVLNEELGEAGEASPYHLLYVNEASDVVDKEQVYVYIYMCVCQVCG